MHLAANNATVPFHFFLTAQRTDTGVAGLLARGADRDLADVDGNTPIDLARTTSSVSTSDELRRIIELLE